MGYITGLTKEEAVRRHRELWNKIHDMTLEQKRAVDKEEALIALRYNPNDVPCCCWACTYDYATDGESCSHCPLLIPANYKYMACTDEDFVYSKWKYLLGDCTCNESAVDEKVLSELAQYAKEIAELPENPDVK